MLGEGDVGLAVGGGRKVGDRLRSRDVGGRGVGTGGASDKSRRQILGSTRCDRNGVLNINSAQTSASRNKCACATATAMDGEFLVDAEEGWNSTLLNQS